MVEFDGTERRTIANWFKQEGSCHNVAFGPVAERLLRDYGFGKRHKKRFVFNKDDLFKLKLELLRDGVGDPFVPEFLIEPKERLDKSATDNDEKDGARPVTEEQVLCRPLSHWHIDGQRYPLPPLVSFGEQVGWRSLFQISHSHLVLVENLALMPVLQQLALPEQLGDALFLFRGEKRKERQIGPAYDCFRAFKGKLPLVYFGDFDPAGLELGLSCGADQMLLPSQECWETILSPTWQNLKGSEERLYTQGEQARRLFTSGLPEPLKQALLAMDRHKQTRTQEHLFAHRVPLQLLDLA